jgi:sterol desaturase/sphingolipid hydroxylase (fatty acid hydroxylase superfamily)
MNLLDSLSAIAMITAGMALVALIETVAPLRAPGRWSRAHRGPNLALTVLTFAANLVLNVALLALVVAVESAGIGVLHRLSVPPLPAAILAVAGLDLAFYAAHVSWHKIPPHLHKIHHSRVRAETDTNYGNRLSVWDRFFGTFTPSRRAETVVFGLDGFDAPELQTTTGLLALPFRRGERARASAPTVS